ncbi:unnamed protein product [Rotaria sp. Silwood1]|nr:unnamed protein product [Rotaria sp. Silwood1]CAF3518514.1 unnamed protein product [Rotaria sp. Silwood1]CAF3531576.1 unnamed protein product [Rotaria sp. Silwood1]CAF4746017.1 unnamed protein product [Rotaria sp. Silwood1]CAF4891429.1 unnamed protein product [Rotaria sp. Silwood1]
MSTSIQQPTQLTRDETRILEECEQESLIYRSLPFSVCAFFAIQYAMSKNIISTKAKWFKLGAGVFAGYMIGKFSYAIACQKKILMKIPDSNLAKIIRGVEIRQISNINVNNHEQRQTNNLNEAVILESDTHLTSIDINQYGDPIYKTNK